PERAPLEREHASAAVRKGRPRLREAKRNREVCPERVTVRRREGRMARRPNRMAPGARFPELVLVGAGVRPRGRAEVRGVIARRTVRAARLLVWPDSPTAVINDHLDPRAVSGQVLVLLSKAIFRGRIVC